MLAAGLQGMFFGNGGSAADAQHIAVELVSASFGGDFRWPALALTIDSSALTAGIVDIPNGCSLTSTARFTNGTLHWAHSRRNRGNSDVC